MEILEEKRKELSFEKFKKRFFEITKDHIQYLLDMRKVKVHMASINGKGNEIDDLVSEDDQKILEELDRYNSNYYLNNQFKDFQGPIKFDESEYSKWFEEAKKSYIYTIPFMQMLELSNYSREGNYTGDIDSFINFHGDYELGYSLLGLEDYDVLGMKYVLENNLEPYVMASILGKYVHLEEFNNIPYVVCIRQNRGAKVKLAISLSSKEIFYVLDKKLYKVSNSYEYLFKKLCLPVKTVLDTATFVNSGLLYEPELIDYDIDEELFNKIQDSKEKVNYDEVRRLTKKSDFDYMYN